MSDPRTDEIARQAARLLETGRASSVGEAVRVAVDMLGHHDVPRPGHGRVREHARGMSMQAQGAEAYAASIRDVWRTAEELMTVLELAVPDASTLLVGRAAEGLVDGGVTLHVRAYTESPISTIADVLVEHGYAEPSFETAETRFGRLDRIRFTEACGDVVVTRCPESIESRAGKPDLDLFEGRPIATATGDELRRRLESGD
jgi:hypothetical protein